MLASNSTKLLKLSWISDLPGSSFGTVRWKATHPVWWLSLSILWDLELRRRHTSEQMRFNWGGKIHPEYRWHQPRGQGKENMSRTAALISVLASWLWTCGEQQLWTVSLWVVTHNQTSFLKLLFVRCFFHSHEQSNEYNRLHSLFFPSLSFPFLLCLFFFLCLFLRQGFTLCIPGCLVLVILLPQFPEC